MKKRDYLQDASIIENYVNYCNIASHDLWTEEEREQSKNYIFSLIEEGTEEEITRYLEREMLEEKVLCNEAEAEEIELFNLLDEVRKEK